MKTYDIISLGCPKNLVDSEVFAHLLEQAGYEESQTEFTELVLINTCAFLQSALKEFDEILASVAETKAKGLVGKIIVSGCVMNRAVEDFRDIYPEVDLWLPLKDFSAFAKYLGIPATDKVSRTELEPAPYTYLRISDGCNNRCSYCAIPSIRGCLKSQKIEDLVAEAKALEQRGVKELVLIAQDTCSYGLDIYGKKMLPALIAALIKECNYQWYRIMYMHPDNFELEWLELYRTYPKLLPYFEIPVQHFSEPILQAMNRKTNGKKLIDLFASIRKELPQAVFRTTLICGFPGESPKDFSVLKQGLIDVKPIYGGAFAFSSEPGTPAHNMAKSPTPQTAKKRSREIEHLFMTLSEAQLQSYVGKQLMVLVEDDSEDGETVGRAWFQAPEIDGYVITNGDNLTLGDMILVEIEDAIGNDLYGSVVTKNRKQKI